MPYGMKTISAIFQRAFEQVLGKDIKNMVCYHDNICIGATYEIEVKKKTDIILNWLRNAKMTISFKKCVNNWNKISFLGSSISKEVISPYQDLIKQKKKPEMKIFYPKKGITLTTHASEHSISRILSQEGHPIMYLSRRQRTLNLIIQIYRKKPSPLFGQPLEPDNL